MNKLIEGQPTPAIYNAVEALFKDNNMPKPSELHSIFIKHITKADNVKPLSEYDKLIRTAVGRYLSIWWQQSMYSYGAVAQYDEFISEGDEHSFAELLPPFINLQELEKRHKTLVIYLKEEHEALIKSRKDAVEEALADIRRLTANVRRLTAKLNGQGFDLQIDDIGGSGVVLLDNKTGIRHKDFWTDSASHINNFASWCYEVRDMNELLVTEIIEQFEVDGFVEHAKDISNSGISRGFTGFAFKSQTIAFFESNKNKIIEQLELERNSTDTTISLVDFVASYRTMKDIDIADDIIAEFLGTGKIPDERKSSDEYALFANAITWGIAETVCNAYSDFTDEEHAGE